MLRRPAGEELTRAALFPEIVISTVRFVLSSSEREEILSGRCCATAVNESVCDTSKLFFAFEPRMRREHPAGVCLLEELKLKCWGRIMAHM